MQVYYSPTQTNRVLVSKMKDMPKFRNVIFLPLAEDQIERVGQLSRIEGRAAFLWGDGESHHESHFFTRDRAKLKINLDHHTDCEDVRFISYFNHMTASRNSGMEIVVPSMGDLSSDLPHYTFLCRAMGIGARFGPNEVAITLDLDVIPHFPVLPKWMFTHGLDIEQPAVLIHFLGERIGRLDLGGTVEWMPDFTFNPNVGLSIDPADLILFFGSHSDRTSIDPGVLSRVGSVVLKAYILTLEAFFDLPVSIVEPHAYF
ncbi:Uncharacterised protein [Candidatus Bilamarchaeum dharawalense]|uniref:Uncharacterized protein n=1 Tax=Candidatus Bilamarchaeum dharawalense TaxID=2885759 RepID=A0A5E4LLJ2_9ARCH|nr:Uncharacterised protein [Candidatus Bilamarchaeum dharawalense]